MAGGKGNININDLLLEEFRSLRMEMKQDRMEMMKTMKDMRESLVGQIGIMQAEMTRMNERVNLQDTRTTMVEKETRRRNIIVHGIEEKPNENWSELQTSVLELLNEKMEVNIKMEEIDQILRMGRKHEGQSRPINIKLITYWRKQEILRNTGKLKGIKIYIDHDLSKEEIQEKKKLLPIMMELRKNGNHAVMKGCNLIVNGQLYGAGSQERSMRIESPNKHTKSNETQTRTIQKRLTSPEQSGERREDKNKLEQASKKLKITRTYHQRSNSLSQLTLDKWTDPARMADNDQGSSTGNNVVGTEPPNE